MRRLFVWIHRWVGLTITIFLVIVALTGSVIAFREELDHGLNPDLFTVPVRDAPQLDPLVLREKAEALEPRANVDFLLLKRRPDESFVVFLSPKIDPATAKPFELPENELFLDPYTGEKVGARYTTEVSLDRRGLVSFLLRLHYSLALPENLATYGGTTLGVVALAWTIDCFIAFYLTLPTNILRGGRGFLTRWKPAWLVKRGASSYRLNFDLHRASGLWFFPLLLILAWSGVCFNLNGVYRGVMDLAFDFAPSVWKRENPPSPDGREPLAWEEAERIARDLMAARAASDGFIVDRRVDFSLDRATGLYVYGVHSDRDVGEKYGGTTVAFDAYSGAVHGFQAPSARKGGDTVTTWLVELHMANVFGLPYRLFVFVGGLAIALLSVTGVVIWWKKRGARRHAGRMKGMVDRMKGMASADRAMLDL